ncbi:hypothetical protein GGS21DRAFT_486801 [Xylaria nigripes]|nr:hypothetical protein GGS21DRAFT_486801 [Xylaria nigripes]
MDEKQETAESAEARRLRIFQASVGATPEDYEKLNELYKRPRHVRQLRRRQRRRRFISYVKQVGLQMMNEAANRQSAAISGAGIGTVNVSDNSFTDNKVAENENADNEIADEDATDNDIDPVTALTNLPPELAGAGANPLTTCLNNISYLKTFRSILRRLVDEQCGGNPEAEFTEAFNRADGAVKRTLSRFKTLRRYIEDGNTSFRVHECEFKAACRRYEALLPFMRRLITVAQELSYTRKPGRPRKSGRPRKPRPSRRSRKARKTKKTQKSRWLSLYLLNMLKTDLGGEDWE